MLHSLKILIDKIRTHKWKRIYLAIDLHGTILRPNYNPTEICTEFYDSAIQILQYLTKNNKFCLILWSSTSNELLQQYEEYFNKYDIKFDFINENREIKTQEGHYGSYEDKFYFDLLLDDKANFDPNTWDSMLPIFQRLEEIMDEV